MRVPTLFNVVPTLITVCTCTHYCDHVVAMLRVLARCFNVEIIPVCERGCEVDIVSTDIITECT